MSTVEKLIEEIIPYPADYSHRNGFSNDHIIDKLNSSEKLEVEKALIAKLSEHPDDLLIVETLTYLNSKDALDSMYKLLTDTKRTETKIVIASCIFQISKDPKMCDLVFEAGKRISDKYSLISMFYYLAKMNDKRINDLIRQYENHADYLLSYNAKRSLGNHGQ